MSVDQAGASKVELQYLASVVQKGLENVLDYGGGISIHNIHHRERGSKVLRKVNILWKTINPRKTTANKKPSL